MSSNEIRIHKTLARCGILAVVLLATLFNRANDETRWKNAYTQMKAELDSINSCGCNEGQTSE